jgi:hypothetical protein
MKPSMSIILNLSQPLPYNEEKDLLNKSFEEAYASTIKKLDASKAGCEAVLILNYNLSDAAEMSLEKVGFAKAPGEEVRLAVAKGETIPLCEHNMEIKRGKYKFSQLPTPPAKDDLFGILMPLICDNKVSMKGKVYVRLLKETDLALLVQAILPLKEEQN